MNDEPRDVASQSERPLRPIESTAAWRGDQLSGENWAIELTDTQVSELELLGAQFVADNPDLRFVQAADYPLTLLAESVRQWTNDVYRGRGFALVRGLRSHLYSDALSAAIFFILGLHMGDPIRQNELGDVVDHIYATSDKTLADPTALPSKTRDNLSYHRDGSDIVALMCLRPAQTGGTSCLVSSVEVYNEIIRRRPDLAPRLFDAYPRDWRRQDHDSPELTYPAAVVELRDGDFNMYAGTPYIFSAQEYPGVPQLTQEQADVLNLLEDITREPGMALEMDFQPGDIQWVSNDLVMHSRTQFWDHPEPQRRRHLLRLWLSRKGKCFDEELGGSRMQARDKPRDDRAADDLGNFRIAIAAVPRLIA